MLQHQAATAKALCAPGDPARRAAVGRRAFWRHRLDRLGALLGEGDGRAPPYKRTMMIHDAVTHDMFTLERAYRSAPEKVFAAWADPVKKRRWFAEGEGWVVESFEADFREGGTERSRFRQAGGPPMTNDTFYHDIVPGRRIVSSYDMTLDGARFSVSLATLTLEPSGRGTLLRYTEQAAFFGGVDGAEGRRRGCADLLEKLATELGETSLEFTRRDHEQGVL